MKNLVLSVFALIICAGCHREITPEELSQINGYWEIEKVKLPDGQFKDYKVNETIDYFKIEGKSGFRKKVMPQFDGKYLETGTAEKIEVVFKDGKAWLKYKTSYAEWEEEIVGISNEELVFRNQANLEYHYKKPQPFSIK